MKMEVFSVYDLVTNVFQPPLYAHNAGDALRIIQKYLDGDNNMSRHPADFALYHLGSFDDGPGLVSPIDPPVQVIAINELVKKE